MESLSLEGNLEKQIVLDKICKMSVKDERGRRKSFRITRQEINDALKERINEDLFKLFGDIETSPKNKLSKHNTSDKPSNCGNRGRTNRLNDKSNNK